MAPSRSEIEFSTKAYKMTPQILVANFNYATMLKDCLWQDVYRKTLKASIQNTPFPDRDDTYKKCWDAFE